MNNITSSSRINFSNMIKELVGLDFDAIEAYKLAINRLEKDAYKIQLKKFQEHHQQHVIELNHVLVSHGEETIKGPTGKQWIVKGEILLGKTLNNDKGILKAMTYVEEDTNRAYEIINQYKIWDDAVLTLTQGLKDEREHKEWLEETLGALGLK